MVKQIVENKAASIADTPFQPKAQVMPIVRFLLLEDNLADAEKVQTALTNGGIDAKLLRVETRPDFVTALETKAFDLILAAYTLTDFEGLAALETALDLCPETPLIFVSTSLGEELAIEALKRGATDFVLKPRLERLVPSVHRALREAQERRDRKRIERNQKFLTTVTQNLAETVCVEEIVQTIGASLNRYLQVSVCVFGEINERADEVAINYDWHQDDRPSLIGVHSLPEFVTDEFLQIAKAGEPIVVRNYATDSRIVDPSGYDALNIGAEIHIPLIRDGEWRFSLVVFHQQAYDWRADEIELMQELASRTWAKLERARAEAALRESRIELERQLQKFDTTLSTISDLVFSFDRDGRFLYANQVLLDLWGLTAAEAIGKTMADLDYPATVERQLLSDMRRVFETGETVKAETPYTNSAGIEGYFEYILSPFFAADRTVEFVVGSSRNISDRKAAEAALHQSEERYRTLFESIDQGFCVCELIVDEASAAYDYRILETNPAFETLTDLQQATGKTGSELIPGLEPFWYETYARVVKTGEPTRFESYLQAWNRWFDVYVTPIGISQNQQFAVLFSNITDRKRAEAEREQLLQREQTARETAENANRIKDEFLAVLSHELRSPLNPILGWTRLLQTGKLAAARQAEALATIERNAKLQTQLIEDLLDISRIMQGKLSLTAAPVSLSFVISAALETVRLAAEAKQIAIALDLDSSVVSVSGDATRLQQVVWNLLTNAVKFTPNGGQVTVELRQCDRVAQIRVIDTGKGINPQFLPHVFEYFRQEDGSTTRKFGGLGLGLAIARQIVELHGGTIAAQSAGEGQGATFTVQIPLASRLNALPAIVPPSDATENLSGIRILVVDDETDSREFVAFVLEQAGAIVTRAASGIDALQTFSQFTPDLIVSDIGMPEMNGYMLMRQICALSEAKHIRTIALTAYAGELDQQRAIAAGFQAHLAKPVEPDQLLSVIHNLIASV